jgi:hypothetical protein
LATSVGEASPDNRARSELRTRPSTPAMVPPGRDTRRPRLAQQAALVAAALGSHMGVAEQRRRGGERGRHERPHAPEKNADTGTRRSGCWAAYCASRGLRGPRPPDAMAGRNHLVRGSLRARLSGGRITLARLMGAGTARQTPRIRSDARSIQDRIPTRKSDARSIRDRIPTRKSDARSVRDDAWLVRARGLAGWTDARPSRHKVPATWSDARPGRSRGPAR